jgi:hypothetical protein
MLVSGGAKVLYLQLYFKQVCWKFTDLIVIKSALTRKNNLRLIDVVSTNVPFEVPSEFEMCPDNCELPKR